MMQELRKVGDAKATVGTRLDTLIKEYPPARRVIVGACEGLRSQAYKTAGTLVFTYRHCQPQWHWHLTTPALCFAPLAHTVAKLNCIAQHLGLRALPRCCVQLRT